MVRRKKLLSGVLLLSGMLCTGRVMAQQWLYKQAAVPIEYSEGLVGADDH